MGRGRTPIVEIAPGVTFGGPTSRSSPGRARWSPKSRSSTPRAPCAMPARRAPRRRIQAAQLPVFVPGTGQTGLELLALRAGRPGLRSSPRRSTKKARTRRGIADCIQIGARNMQNYSLLRAVGKIKPVLLKRGMAATIKELLFSAEYILAEGNEHVILCERGIRSFDTATRNLFDLTAIPIVQRLSHLPIIADPSHGTGLARQGHSDGARRRRRRRRRYARRSAPDSRPSAVRRRTIAVSRISSPAWSSNCGPSRARLGAQVAAAAHGRSARPNSRGTVRAGTV